MRELAKSMVSFSAAMGVMGMKSLMGNLNQSEQDHLSDEAQHIFHHAAKRGRDTLDDGFLKTYDTLNDFGQRMVDMGMNGFDSLPNPGSMMNNDKKSHDESRSMMDMMNPMRMMEMGGDMMRQMTGGDGRGDNMMDMMNPMRMMERGSDMINTKDGKSGDNPINTMMDMMNPMRVMEMGGDMFKRGTEAADSGASGNMVDMMNPTRFMEMGGEMARKMSDGMGNGSMMEMMNPINMMQKTMDAMSGTEASHDTHVEDEEVVVETEIKDA